jgi:chorismate mutase / prephenate dehydratase
MADTRGAAIASQLAADLYGIPIVRERIQDRPENFTRFALISIEDAPRTGSDKTTIAFSPRDALGRGALLRVLAIFDEEELNLTRIESRPSRTKPWEYVFLADLEGHRDDPNLARAMSRLRDRCPMLKHLGSYPRHASGTRPVPEL